MPPCPAPPNARAQARLLQRTLDARDAPPWARRTRRTKPTAATPPLRFTASPFEARRPCVEADPVPTRRLEEMDPLEQMALAAAADAALLRLVLCAAAATLMLALAASLI